MTELDSELCCCYLGVIRLAPGQEGNAFTFTLVVLVLVMFLFMFSMQGPSFFMFHSSYCSFVMAGEF